MRIAKKGPPLRNVDINAILDILNQTRKSDILHSEDIVNLEIFIVEMFCICVKLQKLISKFFPNK